MEASRSSDEAVRGRDWAWPSKGFVRWGEVSSSWPIGAASRESECESERGYGSDEEEGR